MLGKRIASAAILIPLVALVSYWGSLPFLAVILIVGLAASFEYFKMLRQRDWHPSYAFGLGLTALLILDGQWPESGLLRWGLLLFPLLALTAQVFRGNKPGSLTDWSLATAGAVYIGYALSFFIRLRAHDQGLAWLALALLSTWICDTGAYFVGVKFGKHRLCPAISPKKTWEGALGGLVSGVLAVILLGWWLVDLPIGWGLILGIILVLAATFGDLAESVIKRQVGVKDSGNLIPGHGGMLDRIDSLLFVVPVVYGAAWLIARLAG